MSNKMISLFSIGKTQQIGQQTTNNYGLDEEALIENARKNLHEAVTEEYISDEKVVNCCTELKKLQPEDPLATFYETAVRGTPQELAQHLLALDCHSFELTDLEGMATFLIKSLKTETCNPVAMFIDRIGGVDPSLHERVATRFAEEAPKVDEGIYDVTLPRDVFVAYRSADMDKVVALVEYLENTEGLKCFVSYRDLQHGIGAKDHYDEWLKMAMDSCQVLVFVSSLKSRREGDARRKELPYVRRKDVERSPAEYQAYGNYAKIPEKYKKPRVEYLIEPYTHVQSEGFAKEFFDGFTQRESPEAVAKEIFRILDFGEASLQKRETTRPAADERAEERRKAEEARKAEELKQKPWLAPDYPTLKNYDKTQFEIEGTTLKKYLKKDFAGEVKIPHGVTSIEESAFEWCSGLTSITIPDGVKSIEEYAFQGCSGLTSITIPNSVTSIWEYAFYGCSGLTSITIPNSVTSIWEYAFYGCSGLTSITIPNSVESIGAFTFCGCSGLTSIKIPNSVKSIRLCAFSGCSGLTSITIPEGVTSIREAAFEGCSGLTSITIPNSVTSIGGFAFV